MKIVVNTNRLVAALVKDSTSRHILKSKNLKLFTIRFGENEIQKYKETIMKKAEISEEQFDKLKEILLENIEIVDDGLIKEHMKEAKEIIGQIDEKDAPFIAAAIATKSDIWSDDKHFEKQNKIRIWKTKDLIKYG